MFQYSSSFNRDLSQWEVSNVTDMSTMFSSSFNRDLSLWEVSNVIDMSTTSQPVNENADEDDDELGNSVDTSGWDEMITICPDRTIDEKIMQSVMYTFNGKSVWTGKLLLFRLEYNYATQLYSNWKNLKECPVCFGITTNYQKLDCNHYLCSTCFKQMTNRGDCHYLQKCPMCRAPISKPKPKPNTIHSEANIQLVMDIARVNRIEATRALTASNGDLIMAIMSFVD